MDNKSGERDDNADGEMERAKPAYSLHRLRVCVCEAAHGLGSNAGSYSHFYLSIDKSMGLRVGAARQTTAALLISANAAILL